MKKSKPLTDESGEVRELLMEDIKRFRPASEVLTPSLAAKLGIRGQQDGTPIGNKLVANWFDGLEGILETESKLNSLLDHNSTIGQAREFLVTRVLKTILPAAVHIGSGKVIDHQQGASKQVDIVVYDPRFPMMKLEGGGLYFVEGVLAAIEVKSWIDATALAAGLENCKSVLELQPAGEHPQEAEARIKFYMDKGGLNHSDAEKRFWYMFRPATYLFGFNSQLSLEMTTDYIRKWWENTNSAYSSYFPLLPRVITSGNVVGVANDGRINLGSQSGSRQVMSLFHTSRRFRWFALHLMDAVSARLGLRNFAEQFDYRLSDYYPLSEYLREIDGTSAKFIFRSTGK